MNWNDSEQRTWTIKPTVGLLEQVKTATKIDLSPDDNNLSVVSVITELLFQSRKLGEVLWQCCKDDAESRNISRDIFYRALDGEALTAGWGALIDAVVAFAEWKDKQLGNAIREAIETQMRVIGVSIEAMNAAIKSEATADAIANAVETFKVDIQRDLISELS